MRADAVTMIPGRDTQIADWLEGSIRRAQSRSVRNSYRGAGYSPNVVKQQNCKALVDFRAVVRSQTLYLPPVLKARHHGAPWHMISRRIQVKVGGVVQFIAGCARPDQHSKSNTLRPPMSACGMKSG